MSRSEISVWASDVIDKLGDPPFFLYTMLDMPRNWGRLMRQEIGFVPSNGLDDDADEWKYLYQIAVRRGRPISEFFVDCLDYEIEPAREKEIDQHFKKMFDIDVGSLPPLEEMRDKIEIIQVLSD